MTRLMFTIASLSLGISNRAEIQLFVRTSGDIDREVSSDWIIANCDEKKGWFARVTYMFTENCPS